MEDLTSGAPAIGEPTADAPAAPEPGSVQPQASGGETPAGDTQPAPGPVPYDRFKEVNDRYQALKDQHSQFEGWIGEGGPVARLAREFGVTPEQMNAQIEQMLAQPQAPAPQGAPVDPEQAYDAWVLQKTGLATADIGYETERGYRQLYVQEQQHTALAQRLDAFERFQQTQAQQAQVARLDAELQSLTAKHPALQAPPLQQALRALHQQDPRRSLQQHAAALLPALETLSRNSLTTAALQQAADQRRPPTNGGAVPAPGTTPDIANMSEDDFDKLVRSEIRTRNAAAG